MNVYEGDLDEAQLSALVDDLADCAQIDEVRVKGGATSYSSESPGLADAVTALREGRVRGVQILYRHDGKGWCDTLVARGAATRLVRNQIPQAPQS
ncbi:MAG: hypothetical protein ACRBN8_13380 [Nannocystales bacterium]